MNVGELIKVIELTSSGRKGLDNLIGSLGGQ